MLHDRPARGRLLVAVRASPAWPAWPRDRGDALCDRSRWRELVAYRSYLHLASACCVSDACTEPEYLTDHKFGALLGHEMPATRKGVRLHILGDHGDHFPYLPAKAFLTAERDDRHGDLGAHQRLGLLHAREGGAVDAHASQHSFVAGKCSQIFVNG